MDISSMLEVQVNEVKEVDSKENVTPKELLPSTTNVPAPISQEEYTFYKLVFGDDISQVRFQRLHCTACDLHIGSAPVDSHNMFEHPVLRVLLCATCRDFYGDGTFEQGDDATDMFCRWCANGGNLYCCSFCSNTFCNKCIKRNFDPLLRKKIEADERWKCFVCDPTDLYNLRAICWALLQHIQTMNRLLQNNNRLSQDELDERMNNDESKCCPRKKKRKRRRNSNSDDEDETFVPKQTAPTVLTKRKKRGRKPKIRNGDVSIADRNSGMSEDSSLDHGELLPSLLSCEQTMLECENATVSGDGTIISQSQSNPVYHQVNPSPVGSQQQAVYDPIINAMPSANFMPPASPVMPFRPSAPGMVNQSNQMHQMSQMQFYRPVQPAPAPMVTIPNQNMKIMKRARFPLQTEPQTPPGLAGPVGSVGPVTSVGPVGSAGPPNPVTNLNVIEIESDSEDVTVVSSSRVLRKHIKKAVPVALVSSKGSYNSTATSRKDGEQDKRTLKTLNQRLLPHSKDINSILTNLKIKFQALFDMMKRQEYRKYEVNDARLLIKQFHRELRDTVTQLAFINDRIVREYNKWKRHQKLENVKFFDIRRIDKIDEMIPLEMTCSNESDSDTEISEKYSIIHPSDLIGTTSVTEGISLFKKGPTVDRGVGENNSLLVDKSVQIDDVELQDYDKSIRHSTIKQMQPEKKNSASTSFELPASYEEQFIQFLQKQYLEEEECSKKLPDPNETSLKDLIEANSPFISEMLETMDKSTAPGSSNLSSISVKKEFISESRNSISCRTVDDLVETVSNISDDLDKKTAANKSMETKEQRRKRHFSTSGETCATDISKETDGKRSRQANAVDSESSNEDDCTIIDD